MPKPHVPPHMKKTPNVPKSTKNALKIGVKKECQISYKMTNNSTAHPHRIRPIMNSKTPAAKAGERKETKMSKKSKLALIIACTALALAVALSAASIYVRVTTPTVEELSTVQAATAEPISQPSMSIEDIAVPYGARVCGWCSGCGEFHFIWDYHYLYDDCCDNTHGHCHTIGACCDAGEGRDCCDGNCC